MPDIDIDFCVNRRQEVIDYVVQKYGKEKVVQIVTFGTMAAKMCVRDVGRAMALPYSLCDKVAKAIPNKVPGVKDVTLPVALKVSPDLKEMYENEPDVTKLLDMAMKLEGLPTAYGCTSRRRYHRSEANRGICTARTERGWWYCLPV